MPKYNEPCPGHDHFCWGHRHLMREDDLVCTDCYRRLPAHYRSRLWRIKNGDEPENDNSNLSIVVDWLLENPTEEDANCKE